MKSLTLSMALVCKNKLNEEEDDSVYIPSAIYIYLDLLIERFKDDIEIVWDINDDGGVRSENILVGEAKKFIDKVIELEEKEKMTEGKVKRKNIKEKDRLDIIDWRP